MTYNHQEPINKNNNDHNITMTDLQSQYPSAKKDRPIKHKPHHFPFTRKNKYTLANAKKKNVLKQLTDN